MLSVTQLLVGRKITVEFLVPPGTYRVSVISYINTFYRGLQHGYPTACVNASALLSRYTIKTHPSEGYNFDWRGF